MPMLPLPLILQAGAGDRLDIFSLILNASPVVKGVMGLLIGMSVLCWFVIGSKTIYLANAASRSMPTQPRSPSGTTAMRARLAGQDPAHRPMPASSMGSASTSTRRPGTRACATAAR